MSESSLLKKCLKVCKGWVLRDFFEELGCSLVSLGIQSGLRIEMVGEIGEGERTS